MSRSQYHPQHNSRWTATALPATADRTIDYRFLVAALLSSLPILLTAAIVLGGPLAG